jgi:hypothetical protein
LYFTSNEEDFLSDGLMHGLRSLLGDQLLDFPKNELMYDSAPDALRQNVHGRGFTLYGRLPDRPLDRYRVLYQAMIGRFDLIVFSDIQRQFGYLMQLWGRTGDTPIALIDGSDSPEAFPYLRRFLRSPSLALLPRFAELPFFKRELDEQSFRSYAGRLLPRSIARHLPSRRTIHPIAFSIPEEWVLAQPLNKSKDFPEHIVDPDLAAAIGRTPGQGYTFSDEASYHADLRASRYGITTKRAGWDCLRHYEIAAAGAVPCFRDLDAKYPLCAPHGLDRGNTLVYRDVDDLLQQIARLSQQQYGELQAGALAWARRNTTRARALEFLAAVGFPIADATLST